MRVQSESEMLEFGCLIANVLDLPAVIELVGDVGAGKTTFTRGLADGLGVSEPVTSPSFTISKRYAFPLPAKCCKNYNTNATDDPENNFATSQTGELVHYDFYRLSDPGIMSDELAETLQNPATVTVIEWGGDIANLLPNDHIRIDITLQTDGSREVFISDPSQKLASLWITCGKLPDTCAKLVEKCTNFVYNHLKPMENSR